MTKQRFQIKGMHCAGCAMTIDGVVEALPGVRSASTYYARQVTEVEYDDERVTSNQILAAIQSAGYRASALLTDAPR